jgi:signal transduction histidine kinase
LIENGMANDKQTPPSWWRQPGLKLVWGFTLLLLFLTWGGIGYKIEAEQALETGHANRTNLNLTRVLEEHTLRTIKSVDQAVLFLKFRYEQEGNHVDIQRYVKEGMVLNTLFNQLGVIDEHGKYILSNLSNHKVIDLSDRIHFKVHIPTDCHCLFISKPVLGRASGRWSIQMTRRINKSDGSFGGVVVVSLDPYYFVSLYDSLDLGNDSVVTLVNDDGTELVRRAGGNVTFGQSLHGSPVMKLMKVQDQGIYHYHSVIDGVDRFYAFRRVPDYPLSVIVGISGDAVLADFYARVRAYLLFGALVSLTLVAFALATTRLMWRLLEARARAEESNQVKTEFLASVSHELRTPLNGIIGYAELLADEDDAESRHEYAEIISKSGHHLLQLVNSILDLAKVEAGRLQLDLQPENLHRLSQDVLASYQPMANAKGLTLSLALDASPDTFVCDITRLTQVLNNLLHNALKFTEQGEVTLSVNRLGDAVRFSVRDTGPGIEPQDLAVIFEKFRQAAAFESRRHDGAGLGLALSRQLVKLMGGELQVQSTPGQGSEFFFSLPAQSRPEGKNN